MSPFSFTAMCLERPFKLSTTTTAWKLSGRNNFPLSGSPGGRSIFSEQRPKVIVNEINKRMAEKIRVLELRIFLNRYQFEVYLFNNSRYDLNNFLQTQHHYQI